ncbi:MAG: hypothetical protein BHV79_11865 [Bacteroides uniformis]|uniref:Uncharacterized protein n=1 Tax=Bacteroides uniformis TaxID=820 RepID=A0A1Q6HZJ2_BACUN|nr:MAG: hypothetical protein BHV79_11865 [Bacteroides uniformis]
MKSKKLEIEIPEGKTAVWRNGILTLIDEPEKDVRKRIKTFEDACHEIGIDAEAWNRDKISLGLEPDVLAFLKLRIIVKALNEGWEPRFTEDECRYYPWFILYTGEEYNKLDEEEKSRVVYRSYYYAYALGGVSCASAGNGSSYTLASVGVRLAFKTSELAAYCGRQFLDIWADFVFLPEKKSE